MNSGLPRSAICHGNSIIEEGRVCLRALNTAWYADTVSTPSSLPSLLPVTLPRELSFLAPSVVEDLIRVGNSNDGGYVIPRSLASEADFLVSFGLSEDWSFEEHLRQINPSIAIHVYDHTVSRDVLRQRLRTAVRALVRGVGTLNHLKERRKVLREYELFFQQPVIHYEQRVFNRMETPQDATFDQIFSRTHSQKILLKIDIEGTEYRIIDDILRFAERIVGVVIEFHDTEPLRPVFCSAVARLMDCFAIAHLHANNYGGLGHDGLPESLEITFVPGSAVQHSNKRSLLPLPGLDSPNDQRKPDYELRFID